MSKHMQRDLEKLQKLVLKMAGLVEEAVFQATKALQSHDGELARLVVEGDTLIDLLENEVQEECLKILALHQPVAVDLRRISAVILISTDLERMGDLASQVAKRAKNITKMSMVQIPERLRPMTDRVIRMVRQSLDAFVNSDTTLAKIVIRWDDEVDHDKTTIIRGVVNEMKEHPERIDTLLSLFSAVKHLERIADHATNISEDVIYLVEGSIVRHRHELLDSPEPI